jgi:hypothetical protein
MKDMKYMNYHFKSGGLLLILTLFFSCTKDHYAPSENGYVKKIKNGGYVIEQYTYNQANLISEVNSTLFYRKFFYNENNKLIKEEVTISPDAYSSSKPAGSSHEFVDPDKTGISMYSIYEYEKNGTLSRQLNYTPINGHYMFRSMRTYEFDENNMISKVFLHNSDSIVTQFYTYQYDSNGNVMEENYLAYLFIPVGTGPKLISSKTFEYDSYLNPYSVFRQSAYPGLYTNRNNIIKTTTHNYEPSPGIDEFSETKREYEYNTLTGYPVRVINGEEFIYD